MYTILLSGGSGKRLWPLSNELRPKQYIQLLKYEDETEDERKCSMIQRIWRQLEEAEIANNSMVCTTSSQVALLNNQLENIKVIIEPEGRNTFPAIALSCAYLKSKMNVSEKETICIMPVDTFTEKAYFKLLKTLPDTLERSNTEVALLGVKPKYPSSKFGYIIPKETKDEYMLIDHFIEKPSEEIAKQLIEQGAVWNCGVFCVKIEDVLKHCKEYGVIPDYDEIVKAYSKLPKTSFDYEVLEKSTKLSAVIFDGMWEDLGTWDSFLDKVPLDVTKNVVMDQSCSNTVVINEMNVPVITMGCSDMIVVASNEGILISDKEQSEKIKMVLDSYGKNMLQ